DIRIARRMQIALSARLDDGFIVKCDRGIHLESFIFGKVMTNIRTYMYKQVCALLMVVVTPWILIWDCYHTRFSGFYCSVQKQSTSHLNHHYWKICRMKAKKSEEDWTNETSEEKG
ncbi:hypothetical protein STEG23_025543, partial [Scotinomys teguina]